MVMVGYWMGGTWAAWVVSLIIQTLDQLRNAAVGNFDLRLVDLADFAGDLEAHYVAAEGVVWDAGLRSLRIRDLEIGERLVDEKAAEAGGHVHVRGLFHDPENREADFAEVKQRREAAAPQIPDVGDVLGFCHHRKRKVRDVDDFGCCGTRSPDVENCSEHSN